MPDGEMDPRSLLETVMEDRDGPLLCAYCGQAVTRGSERVEILGSHSHVFTNPGGFVFEVGCFRAAGGCLETGEPVLEHTWFPGFPWQIGICAGCSSHLGWLYASGDSSFYGLILERLTRGRS